MAVETLVSGKHETCWRCNGAGRIAAFSHIDNGKCFGCNGSGKLEAGKAESHGKLRCSTFVVDGIAWQFEGIHHGEYGHSVARKDQRVDTVLFQCFAVGAHRIKGETILRARVSPQIGTKVYRDAMAGKPAAEMDNDYLGGFKDGYGRPIGKWSSNTCAMSRNKRGIELLMK